MEPTQILDIGQISALLIILWKLFMKNSDQTAEVTRDVAVLKEKAKDNAEDHDKLVTAREHIKAAHRRLDAFEMKQSDMCKTLQTILSGTKLK